MVFVPYLITALWTGIIYGMKGERKLTVHVPDRLLARAQKAAGAGITETVRKGLELLAAADAYEGLRKLRDKVQLGINLDELREDRRLSLSIAVQ
jgi:hypothetical protein